MCHSEFVRLPPTQCASPRKAALNWKFYSSVKNCQRGLVRNGVVDLWGTADAGHRNALRALVHSVGNVKRINGHLFSTREPS